MTEAPERIWATPSDDQIFEANESWETGVCTNDPDGTSGWVEYHRAPVWKPISTAPKDGTGTVVMLYIPKRGVVMGQWRKTWGHYGFREGYRPTHWMPLPEPPNSDGNNPATPS